MIDVNEMLEMLARPRFDWLQLEVAGVCNASCAYCALTCYKGVREGGLMDIATFERLEPHFARWWLPDRVEFVAEIPKTAVGKFRKTALREQFAQAGAPAEASA